MFKHKNIKLKTFTSGMNGIKSKFGNISSFEKQLNASLAKTSNTANEFQSSPIHTAVSVILGHLVAFTGLVVFVIAAKNTTH